MKSIAFFNNKGGVGKTTLTCNVAAYLALHKSKRVLLIDCGGSGFLDRWIS